MFGHTTPSAIQTKDPLKIKNPEKVDLGPMCFIFGVGAEYEYTHQIMYCKWFSYIHS